MTPEAIAGTQRVMCQLLTERYPGTRWEPVDPSQAPADSPTGEQPDDADQEPAQ